MNGYLLAMYIVVFVGLLWSANQHGKERNKENFWISLISNAITLFLIWGALGWNFW